MRTRVPPRAAGSADTVVRLVTVSPRRRRGLSGRRPFTAARCPVHTHRKSAAANREQARHPGTTVRLPRTSASTDTSAQYQSKVSSQRHSGVLVEARREGLR